MIEYARHVWFRADVLEATRADLARKFETNLTDGSPLAAAREAAAHLAF